MSGGVPSHDTIGRVLAKLNPDALEALFARWMSAVCQGSAALIHRSSAELIHLAAGSRIGVRPPREIGRRRLPPVRQN
jgi:hypothetical protein